MNNDVYAGTQAIRRAVMVLKAFGPDAQMVTPAQLSQRTGLNRSTVYRLLSALEHEGFVASDKAGRYRLGPDLAILGSLALRQMDVRSVALPYLQTLATESGETVDLEVLHGSDVLIIEEVSGDHLLSTSSNIGTLYPANCASTGKMLLAHLLPAQLDKLLEVELVARGPQSIVDREQLRAELMLVREQGYATSYDELEAHLHAIGAAIFDYRGDAIAAVSVSGPAARMPRTREADLAASIQKTCAAISAQLGYRPGVK